MIEPVLEIVDDVVNAPRGQAQQEHGRDDATQNDEKRREGVALVLVHDVAHEGPYTEDRASHREAAEHVKTIAARGQ